jgi:hypothetical protein
MHSVSVEYDQKQEESSSFSTLFTREIMELIDVELHVSYREDWIRFINNLKLGKNRKKILIAAIFDVLKEHNIDTQTW